MNSSWYLTLVAVGLIALVFSAVGGKLGGIFIGLGVVVVGLLFAALARLASR